jgi:hypothetical protein
VGEAVALSFGETVVLASDEGVTTGDAVIDGDAVATGDAVTSGGEVGCAIEPDADG